MFDVSQAGCSKNKQSSSILRLDEKNSCFSGWKNFFKVCRHWLKFYLAKYIFEQFTFPNCDLWSPSNWHYQKRKNQNIFRPKNKNFSDAVKDMCFNLNYTICILYTIYYILYYNIYYTISCTICQKYKNIFIYYSNYMLQSRSLLQCTVVT